MDMCRNQRPTMRLARLRTKCVCLLCVCRSAPSKQGLHISKPLARCPTALAPIAHRSPRPYPNHGAAGCDGPTNDPRGFQVSRDLPNRQRAQRGGPLYLRMLDRYRGLWCRSWRRRLQIRGRDPIHHAAAG